MELVAQQIYQHIQAAKNIIIYRHINPDLDAFGSQFGLKEIIKAMFPDKAVYCGGTNNSQIPLDVKMDEIPTDILDKSLIIIVDTANQERIDGAELTEDLVAKAIKIDHHPNVDAYGLLQLVHTQASSCSEMIYQLCEQWQAKLTQPLSDIGALYLYAGIVGDTGRFLFPNTTAETMRVISQLLLYNFSASEFLNNMYTTTDKLLKTKGYVLSHYQRPIPQLAYITIDAETLKSLDATRDDIAIHVNAIRDLEDLEIWFIAIEDSTTQQIRVRLRSKYYAINHIAEMFDGGGHALASGATLTDWSQLDHLIEQLQLIINK